MITDSAIAIDGRPFVWCQKLFQIPKIDAGQFKSGGSHKFENNYIEPRGFTYGPNNSLV